MTLKQKDKQKTTPPVQAEDAVETVMDEQTDAEKAQAGTEPVPDAVTLTKAEFDQVKEHIEKLQQEKDEAVGLLQRLQADFDNFRKRNASIHADSMDEGARQIIKHMLPVLDNFDRALESQENGSAWRDGVVLVHKQLLDVLAKDGLCEIEADGKFDPNIHEAVMQEECEGMEPEMVVAVLQKGYKVKDRIIRHSMVKVSK